MAVSVPRCRSVTAPFIAIAVLRRLSGSERLKLVEDTWDSVAKDAPEKALPLTPELAAERDHRVAEHEWDPHSALDGA